MTETSNTEREAVGMEALGFIFGIIGISMGASAYALASSNTSRIAGLEKELKKAGVLDKDYGFAAENLFNWAFRKRR